MANPNGCKGCAELEKGTCNSLVPYGLRKNCPCGKCLVKGMCENPCHEFRDYLTEHEESNEK